MEPLPKWPKWLHIMGPNPLVTGTGDDPPSRILQVDLGPRMKLVFCVVGVVFCPAGVYPLKMNSANGTITMNNMNERCISHEKYELSS